MKYRIITDGNQYKAQIRTWLFIIPRWSTLQNVLFTDIVYDTYIKAEKAVIEYIAKITKTDKRWRAAHFDRDYYENVGLPEPDSELSDTM